MDIEGGFVDIKGFIKLFALGKIDERKGIN